MAVTMHTGLGSQPRVESRPCPYPAPDLRLDTLCILPCSCSQRLFDCGGQREGLGLWGPSPNLTGSLDKLTVAKSAVARLACCAVYRYLSLLDGGL